MAQGLGASLSDEMKNPCHVHGRRAYIISSMAAELKKINKKKQRKKKKKDFIALAELLGDNLHTKQLTFVS